MGALPREGRQDSRLEINRLLLGRGKKTMDEMEEGKQKFLEVVKGTDAAVQVVIPVTCH